MGRLSAMERESIILFNEAEDMAEAEVYNPVMRRRLSALSRECPQEVSLTRHGGESDRYTFPKKWIRITPPREATERQREHLADARNRIGT